MIRAIREKDAEKFIELLNGLDIESKFMLFEPGERNITTEEICSRIKNFDDTSSLFLVVEEDNRLVGFITVERGSANRINHKAYIVIGILQDYAGKGIGTRLFEEVEKWALRSGVTRLELDVMCHNERAIGLYKKIGFKIEGIREKAMKVDGRYIDDLVMAKILISIKEKNPTKYCRD